MIIWKYRISYVNIFRLVSVKVQFSKKYLNEWVNFMARRTFFSFHYKPDIWRVYNVRNSWVVKPKEQEAEGFFDASVFEASAKENDDTLKAFLRDGLKNSSVTCVLVGAETAGRRWVRYEIVRSIVKKNGVLAVFIHGIENSDGKTSSKGENPLDQIGLYKTDKGIYFAELVDGKWVKYIDYAPAISEGELWFDAPTSKIVVPLSKYCPSYDFTLEKGRENIGDWIESAATLAGR